ncbi:MAG: hypothetical protein RMA76_09745 [Deltaproteobacteria bacterium]
MSERTTPTDDLSSRVPAGIFRKEAHALRAAAQERRRLLALDTWWTKGGFWTLLVGTAVLIVFMGFLPVRSAARGPAVVHADRSQGPAWTAFAILPAEHDVSLAPGMKLTLHSSAGVREAQIDYVSEVVSSRDVARRLPPRVADTIVPQGPSVIVRAPLDEEARHGMIDGTTLDVEITLDPTPAASWLLASISARTP